MVELKIISGGQLAGDSQVVRHFPYRLGRAPANDLRLEAPGIWDQHLRLDFDPTQGFIATALGDALATVNGWPIQAVILRNGDTLDLGSIKLQFWLAAANQSPLLGSKLFIWLALAAVTAAQLALLLWLL
ncbi:MAG: hypothetical protein RLZZ350_259 [Verrucomicrobiota bacterium]|jgi:pSer/pThr/pTyr-binding forkhead associated (FHA) protein